jgi:XTP/dITP diphosphohydrolase
MFSRLVIATHNRAKASEMTAILARAWPKVAFLSLADFPGAREPEETGSTYAENALIKARAAAGATGEWAIADDAGLEIDALGGEPGLYSKRFAGEETPFPEKMRLILERMATVPDDHRAARFRCAIALCPLAGEPLELEATCEGRIAREPRGEGGFGYDPIFLLPELGRTMAELSADEKHAVSHRGRVLRALVAQTNPNP